MAQLLSYAAFHDRLRQEMQPGQGTLSVIAVIVVNLDFVSRLDGAMGYRAGDAVSGEQLHRLALALRDSDAVAEVSRTELACLLSRLPSEGHLTLALHRIMRALREPITLAGHDILPTPLLGVAVRKDRDGDPDTVLREANLAMQAARDKPEGIAYFEPAAETESASFDLHAALQKAIQENELALFYQPLVDLKTGAVRGAEALLRWNRGPEGFVRPDKIVLIAERTGLIEPLTEWICNTAIRHCGMLWRAGQRLNVSINISVQNLREPQLPELIARSLRLWDVSAENITLELTESAMMDQAATSLQALSRFKDMGLLLAMDDFGTGYSSMARLKDLPLDELKIDMRFVRDMVTVERNEKLVRSMIDLAHALDMFVVAEGVENQDIAARLQNLACDLIQGYLVSRPLPLDLFMDFVRARDTAAASGAAAR